VEKERHFMSSQFTIDCYGASDTGLVRSRNEDQFLVAELQKSMLVGPTSLSPEESTRLFGRVQGHLLLVADGVGGAAAGDHASRIAASTVTRYILNTMPWFFGHDDEHLQELKADLAAGLERCQRSIDAFTLGHPALKGMGTTLTMAYVLWPHVYVVHVGDSRCYLHRDGALEQITTDHTMAQKLLESGVEIQPSSRLGNTLWNVIGGVTPELSPEVHRVDLRIGDSLLLCTDGLTKHASDDAIEELLSRGLWAQEVCQRAVAAANDGGGTDNTTVVVARFLPPPAVEARPVEESARVFAAESERPTTVR
jgi:protein phosphatase